MTVRWRQMYWRGVVGTVARTVGTGAMIWRSVLVLATLAIAPRLLAVTADDLVAAAGGGLDRAALARGEVVWVPLANREVSARDLSALMVVRLSAPLSQVLATLQDDPELQAGHSVVIEGEQSWSVVTGLLRTSLTGDELKRLQGNAASSHFNLAEDELRQLRGTTDAEQVAQAWTRLLRRRLDAYRAGGMAALPPYQRPGAADVHPGRQLIDSARSMQFLREHYPAVLQQVTEYPARPSTLRQQFLFSVEREGGRPLYSLRHQLFDPQADRAIIFERSFYISHSLDALDVAILCLPLQRGTQVAMLTHTFTGKVAGIGQAIAHRIGRLKVKEKTLPMFEALRQRFPPAPDPA